MEEMREEKKNHQVALSMVMVFHVQTIDLAKKEEYILKAKKQVNRQLHKLKKELSQSKAIKEQGHRNVEFSKLKGQKVLQSSFDKAIESFKFKAMAKGKVEDYHQILDLTPTLTRSPHIVIENDKQEPVVQDKVGTDFPYHQSNANQ